MAVGLSESEANGIIDGFSGGWLQLHVGDPGAAGTANPAAETTRQQVTLNSASGGSATNSNVVEILAHGEPRNVGGVVWHVPNLRGVHLPAVRGGQHVPVSGRVDHVHGDRARSVNPDPEDTDNDESGEVDPTTVVVEGSAGFEVEPITG